MCFPVLSIYNAPHDGGTNPVFNTALAAGSGLPIVDDRQYRGGGWVGFGSPVTWRSLTEARLRGHAWYYGDHGYFDRGRSYRFTRNAFQHDGCGERQREPHVVINPWRRDGRHILVCPPDDKIAALMGFDHHEWLSDVTNRIWNNSDRLIKIRKRHEADRYPLVADLSNAFALVTWGSNVAVESVLFGVPVFCTGDCAASVMGRSDPISIEYPVYPDDRHEWAAVLAANQFTIDEIQSGMAWESVRETV